MIVIPSEIFLQRFFDFIYLRVKGLLTPVESENVYKNDCPGYAEGCKEIDTVVHYKFLSLFFKIHGSSDILVGLHLMLWSLPVWIMNHALFP